MILLISKGEMGLAPFTFKLKLGKSCLAIPCMHGGVKNGCLGLTIGFQWQHHPRTSWELFLRLFHIFINRKTWFRANVTHAHPPP